MFQEGTILVKVSLFSPDLGSVKYLYYIIDTDKGKIRHLDPLLNFYVEIGQIKKLGGNKLYLREECNKFYVLDTETLEVKEFKPSCNLTLFNVLSNGRMVFREGNILSYMDYPYREIKYFAKNGGILLDKADKVLFYENAKIKLLLENGEVKEIVEISSESSYFSISLSDSEMIFRISKTDYLYINILNSKFFGFRSSELLRSGEVFGGFVYLSDSNSKILKIDLLNEELIETFNCNNCTFIKSKNSNYLYFREIVGSSLIRYKKNQNGKIEELLSGITESFDLPFVKSSTDSQTIFYLDFETSKIYKLPEIQRGEKIQRNWLNVILDFDSQMFFYDGITPIAFNKESNTSERLSKLINLHGGVYFVDKLYFSYKDTGIGTEIWQTDGTSGGTFLAYDINPGPNGSNPEKPFILKNNLFVFASTPQSGLQLWQLTNNEPKDDEEDILLSTENPNINFSFFPNPTQDYLNVSSTSETENKYKITVFSTDGKVISEQHIELPQKLDLSGLKTGVYLINVRAGKESKTFRVVKQ